MPTPTQDLISVTLAKPHRHGEVDYARGDTIAVDAETADWLEERHIGLRNPPQPAAQE